MENKQIERIQEMERYLDECGAAVGNLARALEEYTLARDGLDRLSAYYESRQWMRDYEDDCAGKLPAGLKRGVLSQDAVYDLLSEREETLAQLRLLLEAERNRV